MTIALDIFDIQMPCRRSGRSRLRERRRMLPLGAAISEAWSGEAPTRRLVHPVGAGGFQDFALNDGQVMVGGLEHSLSVRL